MDDVSMGSVVTEDCLNRVNHEHTTAVASPRRKETHSPKQTSHFYRFTAPSLFFCFILLTVRGFSCFSFHHLSSMKYGAGVFSLSS